ncbi:TonB-dependent receptor [Sedimenticola sp.]|uniref:TonB-dependent receptor n=1 Tax=Sedimenticola sp. TaxID=1940285 RepID=UPI003D11D026
MTIDQVGLIDEIIVTAQKRSENIQDVPISISVIGSETIETKGITNISQIADFLPNVEMDNTSPFSGSSSVLSAYIRGIGQNDFAFNMETGVGLYVDGVYYGRTIGAVVDTLDLERIEVLKGPQGTLFGRNTIGGAVSVITRDPTKEFSYQVGVTRGSFNRLDTRLSLDVPLINDLLYSQFSFSSKQRDGYQKRIAFPDSENFQTDVGNFIAERNQDANGGTSGDEDALNGRVKFLLTPTDTLDITLTADVSRTDETATPSSLISVEPGPLGGLYNTCISTPVDIIRTDPTLSAVCLDRSVVGTGLGGVNVDNNPDNDRLPLDDRYITGDPDRTYAVGSNFSQVDAWGTSLLMDWSLTDTVTLKTITAYRELESSTGVDNSGMPMVMVDTSFHTVQEQLSQEFQLTGNAFDDRLKWVAGLYYFEEEGVQVDTPVFAEGLVQVLGPNNLENEAWAVFTNLDYAITNDWGLTLGLRYTEEEKTLEGRQRELNRLSFKLGFPAALFPDPDDLTRVYPLGINRLKFDDTSVRAGTEYYIKDNIMAYYSYSEGFKSGGWSTRLSQPEPGNIAPTFEPETAKSHELGLKSRLWNDRARFNFATFYTDYENIQVTVTRGLSPLFENAAAGEISGIELEGQIVPIPRLVLTGSLGYLNAKYTELDEGTLIEASDLFVNTPERSASLGAEYKLPLSFGGDLVLAANWSHKSEVANNAENTPGTNQPSINLYNAYMTYMSANGTWDLTLSGKNLSDERYLVSGFENADVGTVQGVYSPPRQLALSVRFWQ